MQTSEDEPRVCLRLSINVDPAFRLGRKMRSDRRLGRNAHRLLSHRLEPLLFQADRIMSQDKMAPIGNRLVTLATAPFVEIRFLRSEEGDAYMMVLRADSQGFQREINLRELERFARSILIDLGELDSQAGIR